MSNRKKHYLGIDPGQRGGLGVLDRDGLPLAWTRMPDAPTTIVAWLTEAKTAYPHLILVAELAQAMPKQGITGAFTYGRHFGLFEVAAVFLMLPYHEVRPSAWKKALGLTSAKLDSIALCQRLWPSVGLVPPGSRKEHDGVAEALLIAEWARRRNL